MGCNLRSIAHSQSNIWNFFGSFLKESNQRTLNIISRGRDLGCTLRSIAHSQSNIWNFFGSFFAKKERKERTPRFSTKFSVINSAYSTGRVEKRRFPGFPQKSPQTVQNDPPAIFRGAIGSRGVFHETNTPYYDYYHSLIVSANGTAKYTSSHLQNTAPAVENRRSTLYRDH